MFPENPLFAHKWPENGTKTPKKVPKIYQSITHKIPNFNFMIKRKKNFFGSIIKIMRSEKATESDEN